MQTDNLEQLRDIHLPPDIGWWPPAFGWWALLTIIIFLILYFFIYGKKIIKKYSTKKYVFKKLSLIEQNIHCEPEKSLVKINILIKKVIMLNSNRTKVSSLNGKQWLHFLDELSATTDFSNGPGKVLATGPYQLKISQINEDLIVSVKKLFKRLL